MTWEWNVSGYYGRLAEYPKKINDLAIAVGGITKEALDLDIDILKKRKDIGLVILTGPGIQSEIIYDEKDNQDERM